MNLILQRQLSIIRVSDINLNLMMNEWVLSLS